MVYTGSASSITGKERSIGKTLFKATTFLLPCLVGVISCSGYVPRRIDNPLSNEGIHSLSIPLFINRSNMANVSALFTREFFNIFHEFTGLKIYSGENRETDAILIGIITSPKRNRETFERKNTRYTDPGLSSSLGERPHFYVPTSTSYHLSVQLVLIKNPTLQELKLLRSAIGPQLRGGPKIIFNRTFDRHSEFNRYVKNTHEVDSAGIVNATMTKHFFEKSLETTARQVAHDFKDLVLNVF